MENKSIENWADTSNLTEEDLYTQVVVAVSELVELLGGVATEDHVEVLDGCVDFDWLVKLTKHITNSKLDLSDSLMRTLNIVKTKYPGLLEAHYENYRLAVLDSNYSKFPTSEAEALATVKKYSSLGVATKYTVSNGVYVVQVTEECVGSDNKHYPVGKIVKSVNYFDPVFNKENLNTVSLVEENSIAPTGVEYLGLVSASDFITGEDLAAAVGLKEGVSQCPDTDWVKMVDQGTTVLFPLKPIRHTLSWDSLSTANVVEGNRTVTIHGLVYKVRLFRGSDTSPQVQGGDGVDYGYNIESARQSEWNRLMYPIHCGWHTGSKNNNVGSYPYGTLAQFTDSDLLVHYSLVGGIYNWCQEVSSAGNSYRVIRGYAGVSYADYGASSGAGSGGGWRPILELVTTVDATPN